MTGCNQKLQIWLALSQFAECVQDEFFLARHRARGNPDLVPFDQNSCEIGIDGFLDLKHVIFEIAEYRDLVRICADRFDSRAVSLRLHTDHRVVFEYAAQPAPDNAISRE